MIDVRRHSHTATAAYHDLITLLLDEAVSEIRGKPMLRRRGERGYWYDRYRIGTDIKERYLGEDSENLRRRVERHEELKAEREGRSRERIRLVRLLRSERFLGADGPTGSLMSAMARTGLFRLGGVLVGTNAFRQYEGELAIRLRMDQAAMTDDIDIASFERLSLALEDHVDPGLEDVFRDFDFAPVPGLAPADVWRWRQGNGGALVEFLTPSFREDEGIRPLGALGVSAQSLHHLNFLIADPVHAALVYRDGVLIRIPRPERFAIHKLIVADRRKDGPDSLKARKDLMQVGILVSVLSEDRPGDLKEAYEDALSRGPAWRHRIEASLARRPDIAGVLETL